MRIFGFLFIQLAFVLSTFSQNVKVEYPIIFPSNQAENVNPDTHFKLTFREKPELGKFGKIRVYDASNDSLVDMLDLSIPPGPTESVDHKGANPPYLSSPYQYESTNYTNANTKPGTPSGGALPNPNNYQLNIIGRFTDAFHFYPIIIHDSTATIYLHNNLLEYNKTYYVLMDSGVISTNNATFSGIKGKSEWVFTTKKSPPQITTDVIVVSGDGTGDFNTVQGAVDFIPDFSKKRITIFIKKGEYEEIVYFRNKSNITFLGEDKMETKIKYHNNEVFNPHPINISTNEWPGTFPSRRAAFMADNSQGIHIINLSIITTGKGQAEGLLMMGKENIVYNCFIRGSGDALQTNGSVYLKYSTIEGDGDTYLGRGPVFFDHCAIYSKGTLAWIRNTDVNHGAVFFICFLVGTGETETEIARAPTNNGRNYPFCEAVLINCTLTGISQVGWGTIGGDASNVHFWEYNSVGFNGNPKDISKRHPLSKQLDEKKDLEILQNYSSPEYVLGGWKPEMAPVITYQSRNIKARIGGNVSTGIVSLAIPEPTYQWYKNGSPIEGMNGIELRIENIKKSDFGTYTVLVKNCAGSVMSKEIFLGLED
jgi:hypothetical protein